MLILEKYGIRLKTISHDDIEMIRQWRNDDFVRKMMVYQKLITEQEQQLWYESICNPLNLYFLIIKNDIPYGLAHVKDIDLDYGLGEAGIFLYKYERESAGLSLYAIAILYEFFCTKVSFMDGLFTKYFSHNEQAKGVNHAVGLKPIYSDEKTGMEYCITTKRIFAKLFPSLEARLIRYSGVNEVMKITGHHSSYFHPEVNQLLVEDL